jgi:hypothetical protein
VVASDSVVIAYGNKATLELLDSERTLGDTEIFRQAEDSLGAAFAPSAFVNVPKVVILLEGAGASSNPTYPEHVEPLLDHVSFGVAGWRLRGDSVIQRAVLGID